MATPVKAKKWGNSMAVRIPRGFARVRGINVGTILDIEKVQVVWLRRRRYSLADLLRRFKPSHRQGEWHTGGPAGNELL